MKYREKVNIPKLGFIDDDLNMNICGKEIKEMHEHTINELNKRKLQVNTDKCVRLHVEKKKNVEVPTKQCEELTIDEWAVEKEEKNSEIRMKDVYRGKIPLKTVGKHEYLGNWIQDDGSHCETIKDRVGKGQGASRDIIQILEGEVFGIHYISALKLLRNSKLISVLTYNLEAIPNL